MRRAGALGLLTLGLLLGGATASPGQPVSPPSASTTSSTPSTTSPSSTTQSTVLRPANATGGGGTSNGLPTLGEGFPWIGVGAVILVAGFLGARLRRAARR